MSQSLISLEHISRTYNMGGETVHALRDINLTINRNEYVAIMGPSGSGKSTLMNMIGCLDTPSTGSYWLNGEDVSTMNDSGLAEVRNRQIGSVFQTFNGLQERVHSRTSNCLWSMQVLDRKNADVALKKL